MPTIEGRIVDDKILLDIFVWEALWEDISEEDLNERQSNMHQYKALLDTGAQISSITQNVVDNLNLMEDGWELIEGVHGSENVPMYTVDMAFTVMYEEKSLSGEMVSSPYSRILWNNPVTLMGIDPVDFDVIFGMDV